MKIFAIVLSIIFIAATICVIIVDHDKQTIPFCVGLGSCCMLLGAGIGSKLQ